MMLALPEKLQAQMRGRNARKESQRRRTARAEGLGAVEAQAAKKSKEAEEAERKATEEQIRLRQETRAAEQARIRAEEERAKASLKVQSLARGRQQRKAVAELKAAREKEEAELRQLEELELAAMHLQAIHKGNVVRQQTGPQLAEARRQRDELLQQRAKDLAAARIEAVQRGKGPARFREPLPEPSWTAAAVPAELLARAAASVRGGLPTLEVLLGEPECGQPSRQEAGAPFDELLAAPLRVAGGNVPAGGEAAALAALRAFVWESEAVR